MVETLEASNSETVAAPARANVQRAIRNASTGLVERGMLPELVALGAVAGEHLLIIGPPGTAKSEAVRRMARTLRASYFEYLLGRFTEPSELFGPIDLTRLREGRMETETTGMLPEAELAFLDEVFLASSAILNTLLGVLNERQFVRGHTRKQCPLRVCVGASNHIPEEPSLAAFADRFLLTAFVDQLPDAALEDLLEQGSRTPVLEPVASIDDLDELATAAKLVDLNPVRPLIARAVRTLRTAGIALSDRRVVRTQRLVSAAATLRGASRASTEDLWPLVFTIADLDGQRRAQESLRELLSDARNPALVAATEFAASSAASRAERLVAQALELGTTYSEATGQERTDARLRVAAWLREVDASVRPEQLTDTLREQRQHFQSLLEG